MQIAPTAIIASVIGSGSMFWPRTERPKTRPDSPIPDRMKPMKSSGRLSRLFTSSMKSVMRMMPPTPTGMLIQKIHRQSK